MNIENKSPSIGTQKKAASSLGKWAIGVVLVTFYILFLVHNAASHRASTPVTTPQVHEVQVTEAQCKEAISELYAVDNGGTASPKDPQYQLIQNLFRQYASEVGLMDGNKDMHYNLPVSSCGRTLSGLINTNLQGAVKSH